MKYEALLSQHLVHTLRQSNTLWLSDYFKISFGAKFYCLNPFDVDFYSNKFSVSSFHAEKPQLASTVKNGRPNSFHWPFQTPNTSMPRQPVLMVCILCKAWWGLNISKLNTALSTVMLYLIANNINVEWKALKFTSSVG